MTYEQIEKVILTGQALDNPFEIRFKQRSPIKGLFIKTADYQELSRKNLWRIVSESNIDQYKKTRDENLAKIFNGTEFTKVHS